MKYLRDLTLGRHYPTDSPVHALDPRVKLVGAVAVLVATLLTESPAAYALLTLFLAIIVARSRLSAGFLLRNAFSLKWLLIIVFVMHALLTPGSRLFEWLPRVTVEGLVLGAIFAWRIAIMISTAAILTATTAPVDLGDALEKLLGPLSAIGVPVHELAMISVIALRFVPTLLDEANRIVKAQQGRGASFEGGLIARARSAVPVLIPLFASAFRRADDLALAMDARCYRGAVGRTKYVELRLAGSDYVAIGSVAVVILATLALSRLL
ncbi:MAG: energy-coupling factor transporter transmembrane protein EcfT [Candidatus Eisenbacteria bacterium]|nr:energy-coupling factor transporter transmembrane protein EcfT [Candidatus Eisenbacteria bacterium]